MGSNRFEASVIKNKIKREEVARKTKRAKNQDKLQKRLAQAKLEANDPAAKKKRLAENVPRTLDNAREFDPSILTADPSSSAQTQAALAADLEADPFADYFSAAADPSVPPKVLITTSPKATKTTYNFCDELVGLFPGAEFVRRKKGRGFEMGRIAGWAAGRGYSSLCVVNEDKKQPNAITLVHLPNGPTAYFKLTSVDFSKQIHGHGRPTTHYPELVMNNFVTRLGHAVGRMFQTLFPPMPEFQGRQVVTLHNQRDFLFLRRHRYAFRSEEKVALQEIGPRFTLKLRWLKKGVPTVQNLGQPARPLEFDMEDVPEEDMQGVGDDGEKADTEKDAEPTEDAADAPEEPKTAPAADASKQNPPTVDEYEWQWKPELETTRRTFFL